MDMRAKLLERAGLTEEMVSRGKVDYAFEEILEAMREIHRGKEVLYGNYMETHGDEGETFSLIQHFCDTKRKYVRAENFVKQQADGGNISLDELLDTYCDLAVYSIIGVQLIFHLLEKRPVIHEDGGDEIPF